MAEYHFPVPGSEREEEIVVFARRHWASFLGQFLLSALLFVIPVIILIFIFATGVNAVVFRGLLANFIVLILSIYYLIVITFAFVSWMSFYYNVYIVTRTEIIDVSQVGFFGREIIQLPLLRVQDVTSSINGFLPTFFGYGDVLIESASEQKEPFVLCNVPRPQEISCKIMDLHDEVVGREGRESQLMSGEGTLVSNNQTPPPSSPAPAPEKPSSLSVPEEFLAPAQAPAPEEFETPKTPYQELLEKDKSAERSDGEGEVSKDDLDKGGEIDLK